MEWQHDMEAKQWMSSSSKGCFCFRKKNEKSQRELDKEEAYRVQQGVLARRKNNSWQKVHTWYLKPSYCQ